MGVGADFQRQGGAYTLSIVMVLCLVTAIAVFALNNATLDAIRITNNSFAAQEAFNAAEIGLAEGVAAARPWTFDFNSGVDAIVMNESFIHGSEQQTVERTYEVTVSFEQVADFIRVYSTATSSDAVSTVSQLTVMAPLLVIGDLDMPPLVTSSCVDDPNTYPNICPARAPDRLLSSFYTHATAVDEEACPTYGIGFNTRPGFGDTQIRCNNDEIPPAPQGYFGINDGNLDLWPAIFTTDRSWMAEAAPTHPHIEWFGADAGFLIASDDVFGAVDAPVLVVFEGCPSLRGTYFGLVFIEPDPGSPGQGSCDARDWGAVQINGSLVVNGGLSNWSTTATLRAWANQPGANLDNLAKGPLQLVPGTWADTIPAVGTGPEAP